MHIADIPNRALAWDRHLELKRERDKTVRLLNKGRIELQALAAVRERRMEQGLWEVDDSR